jgi:protein-tyrosine phosphatase
VSERIALKAKFRFFKTAIARPEDFFYRPAKVINLTAMTTIQRVLFLCTANYYRSRYAEELFNHFVKAEGLAWRAFSCAASERSYPENVGPMSRFTREALAAKGIVPEGGLRDPRSCSLADFVAAELVVALKETEHRPLIERRFPGVAKRITYWHVDDIEFVHPSIALVQIDNHVSELISSLR